MVSPGGNVSDWRCRPGFPSRGFRTHTVRGRVQPSSRTPTNTTCTYKTSGALKTNLTLTLGTGYQIDTPIREYQNGGLSRACFQPGVQSRIFTTAPVGLTYPGDPGCNNQGGPTTKFNHIGPRVGFAWSPDWSNRLSGSPGKTSLRGGFGLYFNRTEEELNLQDLSAPPFGLSSTGATHPSFPNPYADLNTGASIANQFPYVPPKTGATPDFAALYPNGFGSNLSVNPKNLTVPHTFNWNLTLQRELPGQTIFSVGYVGSHGSDLITSYTANPATPAGVAGLPGESGLRC